MTLESLKKMAHNTHCCYILPIKELILKTVSNLKLAKYFLLQILGTYLLNNEIKCI